MTGERCPSCDAWMQPYRGGWRCPWARTSTQAAISIGGRTALICRLPYKRKGEGMVVLP